MSVAGQNVEDGLLRDVMQVTYRDNVEEIDAFELVVNNWDAAARLTQAEIRAAIVHPRLRGTSTPAKDWIAHGLHEGNDADADGEITTLEPTFPDGGAPTLSRPRTQCLHALRTEQHTDHWDNKKDSDIAADLGNRPSLRKGKAGAGIK